MNNARTPLFLMANLGPEVSRIFSCIDKGEPLEAIRALERAQKIITQIRAFPEMLKRLPEIDLLSEVLQDFVQDERKYTVSRVDLQSYIEPFMFRLLAQK